MENNAIGGDIISFPISQPVDIFITCWNRVEFTKKTIDYLWERTKYPFRIIVINNNSDDSTAEYLKEAVASGKVFHVVHHDKNIGIHQAWNTALGLADGEYFITTDNDIYVPELHGLNINLGEKVTLSDSDWLERLVSMMNTFTDYGAIACQPHAYIGCSDPTPDPSGVVEVSHCGAVMRIMRRKAVLEAGGWEKFYNSKRNHEELTVCSRLRTAGYKVGYASYIRCYHDWGDDNNWGYKEVHPSEHGHRIPGGSKFANGGPGELWPSPEAMNNQKGSFDELTWERK